METVLCAAVGTASHQHGLEGCTVYGDCTVCRYRHSKSSAWVRSMYICWQEPAACYLEDVGSRFVRCYHSIQQQIPDVSIVPSDSVCAVTGEQIHVRRCPVNRIIHCVPM